MLLLMQKITANTSVTDLTTKKLNKLSFGFLLYKIGELFSSENYHQDQTSKMKAFLKILLVHVTERLL